jgi:HRAS-like suppressor 3
MALPPGESWFGRRDESSWWGTSISEGPGTGASGQRLYAELSRGLRRGPVQEISLFRFATGHRVSVRSDLAPKFEGREVARRARSRIGKANYRLFTNNCEHFCEWCLRGQHRCYQIDAWLALPSRSLHVSRRVIAELRSLAGRTVLRSTQASAGRATGQRSS